MAFLKGKNINYAKLAVMLKLTASQATAINVSDLEELLLLMQHARQKNDFDLAIIVSKKMATLYGVPGLLQYYFLLLNRILELIKEGEEVKQLGFNALVYLNLAHKLYHHDENAIDYIKKIMPKENVSSPDYWNKKKKELIKLVKLHELQAQAEEASNMLLINL